MSVLQQPAQYLVDASGQRTAVVVDVGYWEELMDLLEDMALVRDFVARLARGPEGSGALRWVDVRDGVRDLDWPSGEVARGTLLAGFAAAVDEAVPA